MLIVTAKVPKRKLAFGVALAAMACCCALVLNLGTSAVREVASPSVPDPKGVKTNEDRVAYLADFGWQVSPEPIATQEMLIPKEMDESYNEYLALQSGQGDVPAVPAVDIGVRTVVLGVPLGKARASPVKELSRQFPIQIIQDEHP